MSNDTVVSLAAPALVPDPLTELLRSGARRLVEAAVRAEFEEHLSAFGHEKLPDGRQRVVRNGCLPERKILTGLGEVDVGAPKARSRSGSPEPFHSSVASPYVRRCASLDAAIPWLYLHGVSTGQMRQAVAALVGERAARGLSANVVSRLKRSWDQEYQQWRRRRLDDEWVYLWADGLYSGLRGEGERLCVPVVIGVNARGEKRFLATEDGVRESTQSWREVLLAMKHRGFTRPAKLAVGDGAMGFWAALSEVFPSTRPQRCWVHKTGNVLNYLPKSGQAKAKQGLHEIWGPRPGRRPSAPSTSGSSVTTTSTPRPPPAWPATATSCSRSTTSPPRTGHTFEPPTSSNRPLPRSAIEAHEPRAASPERPCSQWSTRWVGTRRNPGAGCGASATSPRSSRESGSTTASRSSRTAEPPHEQPPVHQI